MEKTKFFTIVLGEDDKWVMYKTLYEDREEAELIFKEAEKQYKYCKFCSDVHN